MKILVLGGSGFVGKHLQKYLEKNKSSDEWIFAGRETFDLLDAVWFDDYIQNTKPDYIVNLAAVVGGINANACKQFEFFQYNNLIGQNVFNIATTHNIPTLSMLSTCCFEDLYHAISRTKAKKFYPLKEEFVLSGKPEQSNEGYAQAKRNMAQAFLMANKHKGQNHKMLVPCNIMGEYDHFNLTTGHFVASLIRKVYEASGELVLWGDGSPLRQFIHADSLCEVICHFIYNWSDINHDITNVCPDYNYSIRDIAEMAVEVSGKSLQIKFDKKMPNGIARKDGDNTKLKSIMSIDFGDMKEHLRNIYARYAENQTLPAINH